MCSQSHTISINLYTLVHGLYLIFWVVSTTSTLIQPSKCNRKIGKYYWSFRHPNYFSIITTTVTGSCRDLCLQPCSNNECYVWLYLSRVSINCIETFCLGKEQTQTKCDVKKSRAQMSSNKSYTTLSEVGIASMNFFYRKYCRVRRKTKNIVKVTYGCQSYLIFLWVWTTPTSGCLLYQKLTKNECYHCITLPEQTQLNLLI